MYSTLLKRSLIPGLALCLILAVQFAGAAEKKKKKDSGPQSFKLDGADKVLFKETPQDKLHLHVFKPKGWKAGDSRPAIVFFFGGGWNGGTPSQFEPHANYLASRGMVAITAEYRVASRHKTSPYDCVADGKSAVRWIRSHAKELGIDPNRLAAGGGSAGGHVASATATVPGLNEEGEDTSVSCVPDALVLFNPVYDNGPDGGWAHSRVKDRYKEISPAHNIHKGMPPAVVFLGTKDPLIPVSTAERFQKRMKEAGSRSELFLYEGQAHGFFNQSKGPEYFTRTVEEMDRFLVSLGWLKGEPKVKAFFKK